ncbi:MAG: undecaprenyl-diphosphate phosphatase [Balneolaceae bacterium]|nr:undecaprenyl-diphosphate phosphatase [Balneolaceae bacterium]
MSIIDVIILGIIEGLTEFLPISSTGHMILTSEILGLKSTEFLKTFEISIQLGAIMAVVYLYRERLMTSFVVYQKLFVAFLPAAVIGFLAYDFIKGYLFNAYVVSVALIIGGVFLILLDRWTSGREQIYGDLEEVSYTGAVQIGLFQCLAMIPGTSRAAASIFGGIFAGLDRKQATEFSFLLAIPTMFAATGYDLLKTSAELNQNEIILLLTGGAIAFIFAWLAVKAFIAIVVKHGFHHFGYYRIVLGGAFLLLSWWIGMEVHQEL